MILGNAWAWPCKSLEISLRTELLARSTPSWKIKFHRLPSSWLRKESSATFRPEVRHAFSKRWETTAETVSGTVGAHLCTVATRIVIPVFYCKRGGGKKRTRRKQGFDTLGNVGYRVRVYSDWKDYVYWARCVSTDYEMEKGRKIGHDTSLETPQFSFAWNSIVYIYINLTTPMINKNLRKCYFPEDKDHVPLIQRRSKFFWRFLETLIQFK